MTATPESPVFETSASDVRPDLPFPPAEAATDVPPAASLEKPEPELATEPPPNASEIDASVAAERRQLRERIGKSSSLSRGMRDRLAALLDGESASGSDSQPLVRAESVLALLEEAIPPQLRLDAASLAQPEHPAGEAFFTGDPNQMTDDQAERIAREQLARSPFTCS